jgi:hypothetical protein
MKNLLRPILLSVAFISLLLWSSDVRACGHEGIFIGLGYTQLFMYTPEHQINKVASERIKFGPGFGANAVVGYDFKDSRWGIQMPFEYARLKLNGDEWVDSFGTELEAILHIVEWGNGLDFHLIGGAGWTYLTEGKIDNQSNSLGVVASLGPGLSWFFSRTEKVSAALNFEVPIRYVHYFKDRLSANGTSALAVPIRLTMQIGF